MDALADNEVCLLVLDQIEVRTQIPNFLFERSEVFVVPAVEHAVDVEAGLRCLSLPFTLLHPPQRLARVRRHFIAEAVGVLS